MAGKIGEFHRHAGKACSGPTWFSRPTFDFSEQSIDHHRQSTFELGRPRLNPFQRQLVLELQCASQKLVLAREVVYSVRLVIPAAAAISSTLTRVKPSR